MPNDADDVLAAYDHSRDLFTDFTKRLVELLEILLADRRELIHSITGRVKTRDSLLGKHRRGRPYRSVHDVHDIAGIRIITMFAEDVDMIAERVKSEFDIDEPNSVDKRTLLDPDRFGYLSLHYVISLPKQRLTLSEYRCFSGLKAEIQIRSLLQHAWAEIEHDLGYKSQVALPKAVARQFSRLAGLLEVADDQFNAIRAAINAYREQLPEEIASAPEEVDINNDSLVQFVRTNATLRRIDERLAEAAEVPLEFSNGFLTGDAGKLQYVGIGTISQLEHALTSNEDAIVALAKKVLARPGDEPVDSLNHGIGIFYLTYLLVASSGDVDKVWQYLEKFWIGSGSDRGFARQLVEWAQAIDKGKHKGQAG